MHTAQDVYDNLINKGDKMGAIAFIRAHRNEFPTVNEKKLRHMMSANGDDAVRRAFEGRANVKPIKLEGGRRTRRAKRSSRRTRHAKRQ